MRSKKLFLTYTCTFNRFRGAGRAVESVFIRLSLFKNLISTFKLMHQSLPAAPSPPPPPTPRATAGHLPALSVPGVGHLQILRCTGAELLTRTRFLIRIWLHRGFYLKNKQIGSFVNDGKKLKRFVKTCSRFYACISSLLIQPELHSETWELSTWINVFGYWIKFLLILLEELPTIHSS